MTLLMIHQIKGYAFLETFFKHKYAQYQLQFGTHTEYFDLPPDVLQEIDADLTRLKYLSRDRIGKIQAGMQKAQAQGKHIGRPQTCESVEAFLCKPKSQHIMALLECDLSLREIQRQTGYSMNTIRKVVRVRKQ